MNKKLTREQILEVVKDSMSANANNVYHQYPEMLSKLDDEQKIIL